MCVKALLSTLINNSVPRTGSKMANLVYDVSLFGAVVASQLLDDFDKRESGESRLFHLGNRAAI